MTNLFQNLFKPNWWFISPSPYSSELKIYLSIFLSLVILSIICYIIFARKAKSVPPYLNLRSLIFGWLLGLGLTGLFLVFLAWQAIPYLSSRILVILIFLSTVIWFIYLLFYLRLTFYEQIKRFHEEENYKKYLPKKK